jgi:sec-independent protein translocase protein TatC
MAKKRKNPDEMSFLEHLEELRWHLIRATLAVFALAIVAFVYHNFIFDNIILAPKDPGFFTNRMLCRLGDLVNIAKLCINSKPLEIININMAGQFTTHIVVSLLAGLIVAFPYVFWEFWRFMRPALYDKERKYARGAVLYSSLLFLLGILFGYYIIAPLSVNFLGSYSVSEEVINRINLRSYISTVTSVTLAGGITFELPVLVYFLTKVGLITPDFLKHYRKHAIVVILILAAIITPPDVFSQILVFIPLVILYEVSIWISKRITKKQDAAFGDDDDTPEPPAGPPPGPGPATPPEKDSGAEAPPEEDPYSPYGAEMTGEGSEAEDEEAKPEQENPPDHEKPDDTRDPGEKKDNSGQ